MNAQYENMVGGFQKITRSAPRRSEQEMSRGKKEDKARRSDNKRTMKS